MRASFERLRNSRPKWITKNTLMVLHARQVERHGGAHGVRDWAAVLRAHGTPGRYEMNNRSADLADLAAGYLVGFARSDGFQDGNQRTGLACALVFLVLNGQELHVPPRELYDLFLAAEAGRAEHSDVAQYIRRRMTPRNSFCPPETSKSTTSNHRIGGAA
ncbi:MAG TPA: type II toxin-antitoxin system death-on-curing family toxin [Longimicrobiaceae bacterium]|nr:type II toxin-antitoxin system death-on-curing family toxin [Longimicrobiaceae bacterium]